MCCSRGNEAAQRTASSAHTGKILAETLPMNLFNIRLRACINSPSSLLQASVCIHIAAYVTHLIKMNHNNENVPIPTRAVRPLFNVGAPPGQFWYQKVFQPNQPSNSHTFTISHCNYYVTIVHAFQYKT